jgi:hypothetical protein
MTALNIEQLKADLQRRLPDASITLREGRQGIAMLSIVRNERLFVMEFRPNEGYGVDEINDGVNNGWNMGYRHVISDFNSAAQKLLDLLGLGLDSNKD